MRSLFFALGILGCAGGLQALAQEKKTPPPPIEKPFSEKAALPEARDYAGPMKKIAAKFRGTEGVVIHVGGSMTIANPYGTWARNGKGKTPEDSAILKWMHTDTKDKRDGWWLCRTEVVGYRACARAATSFAAGSPCRRSPRSSGGCWIKVACNEFSAVNPFGN